MKVVDFGFACLKPKDENCLMRTPCFTLQYAAPEVLDQGLPQTSCSANGYNESCDLWSLGVILVSQFRQFWGGVLKGIYIKRHICKKAYMLKGIQGAMKWIGVL